MESNRSPHRPCRPFMQPLSPPLVGCLMCEGMDLEDTPLVVEGFSQELQPPPRVLQKKEPGGGGGGGLAQNPFWRTTPHLLPCPRHAHLTAPSLQAAATRGPRSGLSNSHTARDMYLQRTQPSGRRSAAVTPPQAPARQRTSPGLWVHLDHPAPTTPPVPVLVQPVR